MDLRLEVVVLPVSDADRAKGMQLVTDGIEMADESVRRTEGT